ncbi:hypothetical protein [Cryobacterium sp. Y62]|uniref:hypothetical protein n=1 Tax=Cryobacterium sp. Y62 TaxID=2048284 RepID=UPI000CE4F161|nr:hypothetical protein [Cryobacterium sp. Y62]
MKFVLKDQQSADSSHSNARHVAVGGLQMSGNLIAEFRLPATRERDGSLVELPQYQGHKRVVGVRSRVWCCHRRRQPAPDVIDGP